MQNFSESLISTNKKQINTFYFSFHSLFPLNKRLHDIIVQQNYKAMHYYQYVHTK